MLKTEYGQFDGDKWERICQICFKRKYENETYFEIKATPGDFGIEGFTRSGKVFQCYCPDEHYTQTELYEKQRDKITKDLKKLKTYEKELKKRLGDTKIKKWYFVTPLYSKNEIVEHATKKKEEVKGWGLDIIDNDDFEVIPADIDFLHPHLSLAIGATKTRLNINPTETTTEEQTTRWKDSSISLVQNAQRKHTKRFQDGTDDVDNKVESLTEKSIAHFLNGNILLNKWKIEFQEDYEKFVEVVSLVEEQVEEDCQFPSQDNNGKYKEFKKLLKDDLTKAFPNLDPTMIMKLCNQVMADWILRCPIDFE